MTTQDIINSYLTRIQEGIKIDAENKGQKIPVSSFEVESTMTEGRLWAAHYFKYLVHGRGPGKQPPVEKMRDFVRANPGMLEDAQAVFKGITENGLAFLIGRKIGREGTDVFKGLKPGVDLQGAIDAADAEFMRQLADYNTSRVLDKIDEVLTV